MFHGIVFNTVHTHFFFFFFWLHHKACGILASCPGIEPVSPVMEAWSLKHWTTREIPLNNFFLAMPSFRFVGR